MSVAQAPAKDGAQNHRAVGCGEVEVEQEQVADDGQELPEPAREGDVRMRSGPGARRSWVAVSGQVERSSDWANSLGKLPIGVPLASVT
jgi:hypothetical protein